MQNEKVMAVTLMWPDLCNIQGYIGAYLTLPASRGEIQDALDRARIKNDQPYQIVDCYVMQDEELDINLEKASLDELNFLAYRISKLSEHECLAFLGCAMMDKEKNDLQRLINLTYNLVDVRMIPVSNDYELGEFFVENDFIEAISHIPPEYQDELLELFDYEKIGYKQRNAENGIYHNGYYVMNDADDINQVYDGIHLPELPEEPVYVFKLQLTKLFLIRRNWNRSNMYRSCFLRLLGKSFWHWKSWRNLLSNNAQYIPAKVQSRHWKKLLILTRILIK